MQTKRLHISGLTPAISEKDLDARFSVFGVVKAVDGLGQLNAVGQPRNFAFVSLEATPEKISKCLNVLSGSTWKGTKLRIGDARPDYQQKLQMERVEPPRPAKRRRLANGMESRDMSLITLENVERRPGWKKTALSHLVRPLRMRPSHALPSPVMSQSLPSDKKKKRKIVPPTRARRQKIDPTLYGRVHLTEGMLQAHQVVIPPVTLSTEARHRPSAAVTMKPLANIPPSDRRKKVVSEEHEDLVTDDTVDAFQAERKKDLGLLAQLFGGKEKWEGREDDIEGLDMENMSLNEPDEASHASEDGVSDTTRISDHQQAQTPSREPSPTAPDSPLRPVTRLKDLFTSASLEPVSILHGLDLDLEDDFAFDATMRVDAPAEQPTDPKRPLVADETRPQIRHKGLGQAQFSVTAPYFFPLTPHERSRGTVKDIMSIAATKGWMQPFLHPITPEEARKQWEAEKVALTRDWKQRHREASKKQRKGTAINDLE